MDIVERLRNPLKWKLTDIDTHNAANEIERLRGAIITNQSVALDSLAAHGQLCDEIERLREALHKIVDLDWQFRSDGKLGKLEGPCAALARAALQPKESK